MTTLDQVLIGIAATGLLSVAVVYAKGKLAERKAKQENAKKKAELKAKVQPKRTTKKKVSKKK